MSTNGFSTEKIGTDWQHRMEHSPAFSNGAFSQLFKEDMAAYEAIKPYRQQNPWNPIHLKLAHRRWRILELIFGLVLFLAFSCVSYSQTSDSASRLYLEPVYSYSGSCYMLRYNLVVLKSPAEHPASSYQKSLDTARRALYSLQFFFRHLSDDDLNQKNVPFVTQGWVNKESSRKLIDEAEQFFKDAKIPLPRAAEFPVPTFPEYEWNPGAPKKG